jgi:DNA-binding transcriptional MerR regulator
MSVMARRRTGVALAVAAPATIDLETLARQAGMHPAVVRRFVSLGLIEPRGGTAAAPLFSRRDAVLLDRAARLRADLGLNYSGAVLACELLARIEELERQLRGGAARAVAGRR